MRRWVDALGLVVPLVLGAVCIATSAEAAGTSPAAVGNELTVASLKDPPETFEALVELQAMYDEMSQVGVPFETQADVDLFHQVVYTPDFVFVDAGGRKLTWAQVRDRASGEQSVPPDAVIQRIDNLAMAPGGAAAVVSETTVRTVVDTEGRYGRRGATHTLATITHYRDSWVKDSDAWRLKSREQLGPPRVAVDKPELTY